MKTISKPKLIKENQILKRVIANKENNGKHIAKHFLNAYVENLNSLVEQQLIQLRGRTAIADASDLENERNYYIGATDQLNGIKKVINATHDITLQSINETVVKK